LKLSLLSILIIPTFCFSQNKQLLYGFSEIPQSLLLNPATRIDNRGFVGIPLLSHFHFSAGSSGISVYDLVADDGINFNTKLRQAVDALNPTDFTTVNQQLELFSGGFNLGNSFKNKEYLSFGLYQEFDFIGYFPKDYAVLALEGNQRNIGRPFKLDHLNFNADLLSVLHVGYHKKVNSKFTYGVRGKIYSNIANINSTSNSGRFITQQGQNNIYTHIFNLNLQARTSGIASLVNDESNSENSFKSLRKRILFGGNLGLGVDLGISYQINKQWFFDASFLDIGFIRHSKDIENYALKGDLVFEGIDPIFPQASGNQTADDYWVQIQDDFEDLFNVETTTTRYTTLRPIKFNTSLNYSFGKRKSDNCDCFFDYNGFLNAAGAQLYAIKRPKAPQIAFTLYYYRILFKGLRAKVAYTLDSYSFNNIGLGLSAHLGGLNLYFMADNFLQYNNLYDAQSLSLQLGLNYIFKKK